MDTTRKFGLIAKWNDDKGFGFIAPRGGGKEVFVHIRAFPSAIRRPAVGDSVSFVPSVDDKGRLRTDDAEFLTSDERSGSRALQRAGPTLGFAVCFISALTIASWKDQLPWFVPGVYSVASLIAYALYAVDKSAALANSWRVSEQTLHGVSLVGGWPGALVGQAVHRHKTKKGSFRFAFWLTVAANCSALAAVTFFMATT